MTEHHETFHIQTIELLSEIALLTNAMLGVFAVATLVIIYHIYKNR